MQPIKQQLSRIRKLERFWAVIVLLSAGAASLFIYHLVTGDTPSRVAFYIAALDLEIYWYGMIIVGGIALGTYVTSVLAGYKARRIFLTAVPRPIQNTSLDNTDLEPEIAGKLAGRHITTLGDLLFDWGLDPQRLPVSKKEREQIGSFLSNQQKIDPEWLEDSPWRKWNPDYVWGGVIWCLIVAVIGARLYHILTPSPSMAAIGINSAADYFRQPLQLINLRNGGLGIYGGILGGALGLFIYSRKNRIPMIAWADLAVPGVALGQYIGRWGNFFNQELYGRPADLPWAITIEPVHRLEGFEQSSRFHPAFLYESLWNLLAFFVLYWLARNRFRSLKTGDLTALYLLFYAVGRILLELVRLDSRNLVLGGIDMGVPVATAVSIVLAVGTILFLVLRRQSAAGLKS